MFPRLPKFTVGFQNFWISSMCSFAAESGRTYSEKLKTNINYLLIALEQDTLIPNTAVGLL